MKLLTISILVVFLQLSLLNGSKINYKSEITKEAELQNNELLICIFVNLTECQKCITIPMNIINNAINNVKERQKNIEYKLIAIVGCDRDIELKRFKKLFVWEYDVFRDRKGLREQLMIKANTEFVVLNAKSEIIGTIDKSDKYKSDLLSKILLVK